jgi:hypothetical protein
MTEFWLPEIDLDEELFLRRNPVQAVFVILNRLANNDLTYRATILERIKPAMLVTNAWRFIFRNMVEMIHEQGQVDIEQIKQRIPDFAPGENEFTAGNLANFQLALTFNPTPEQVERALEILTSPTPPTPRFLKPKQVE